MQTSADQTSLEQALAHFSQQRLQLGTLGRKIADNARNLTELRQQSTEAKAQIAKRPVNVISLDVARMRVDMQHLVDDTQQLAGLACQLHQDFIAVAACQLAQSRSRMARLIDVLAQHSDLCSMALRSRVDAAIGQCRQEIDQINHLIEKTGASVALLTVTAEQLSMLSLD
jgi:hypothetical protein